MDNRRIFALIIFFILYFGKVTAQEETVYDKIDLFGEVLDKINKEYVEEINQSKIKVLLMLNLKKLTFHLLKLEIFDIISD